MDHKIKQEKKEWLQKMNEKYREHDDEAEKLSKNYYGRKSFFHMMFMSKIIAWKNYAMISSDRWSDLSQKEKTWMSNVVTPYTLILCKSLYEKIFGFKHEADIDFPFNEWEENNIDKWLNTMTESSELVSKYPDIIESMIQHWSARLRPSIAYNNTVEAHRINKKVADVKKSKADPFDYSQLKIDAEVYGPYNFFYDQRKSNVYKSSFFQYCNYEPIEDFLGRWESHLDPKLVEKIRLYYVDDGGKHGDYCDYNRYKELWSVDLYLLHRMEHEETMNMRNLIGEWNGDFSLIQYLGIIPDSDFFIEEHYSRNYIRLRINGDTIAVIDNFYSKATNGEIWHPYVQFNITSSPQKTLNKSVPELLYHMHKMHDMVYNGFADQLKMNLNPMFASDWPINMAWDSSGKVEYEPFGIIEYTGTGKLTPISFGDVNSGVLNILDYILWTGQIVTSITRYSGGGRSWVERSATGADLLNDITNDAVRPTHDGMQISTNRFYKLMMILTKEVIGDYLYIESEESVIDLSSITNIMNFDIEVDFRSETVSELTLSKEINKITTILNSLQPAIIQMAELPDWPFLKLRNIYKSLFDKIQANDFIYSDKEVQEAVAKAQEIINNNIENNGVQEDGVAMEQTPEEQFMNNVDDIYIDSNNLPV